jgi:hypothetical protein
MANRKMPRAERSSRRAAIPLEQAQRCREGSLLESEAILTAIGAVGEAKNLGKTAAWLWYGPWVSVTLTAGAEPVL